MSDVFISKYRLVQDAKPHYVYTVEVLGNSVHQIVEKRYSAFHALHRELRKHFTTPAFPPKRVRCSQPKVLEQRRQGLEHYLQTMMKFGPSRAKIMNFLGVPDDGNRSEAANTVSHRPVFRVYLNSCLHPSHNKLPDIITEGVLSALYTH
ncbi:sorting nexin-24-like [Macrosteles quadrilineatus]|uniref:sorting nexin-24-like n=1 Tax=Macrosteles quadrilineatus TaxID=74068 RepID=UPI0023E31995|nr:sorting nexin-24-like [Macrosteles quadrilineatus]